MATAPVKSQPLHNFSLTFLKWGGKNHTNANHRFRRPVSGDSSSSSQQPPPDHASEPDSEPDARPNRLGSRSSRNRFAFSSCYLTDKSHKQQQQQQQQPPQQQAPERIGGNETVDDGGERKRDEAEEAEVEAEDTTVQKPWNLRPRKPVFPRGAAEIGGNGEVGAAVAGGASEPKSLRLRGMAEMQQHGGGGSGAAERKEKRKFWIALSKEEIEEDIFIMTGSRPARRPKKRPKHIQKQLDMVFPGLWLVGATADSYKIADAPSKR